MKLILLFCAAIGLAGCADKYTKTCAAPSGSSQTCTHVIVETHQCVGSCNPAVKSW